MNQSSSNNSAPNVAQCHQLIPRERSQILRFFMNSSFLSHFSAYLLSQSISTIPRALSPNVQARRSSKSTNRVDQRDTQSNPIIPHTHIQTQSHMKRRVPQQQKQTTSHKRRRAHDATLETSCGISPLWQPGSSPGRGNRQAV